MKSSTMLGYKLVKINEDESVHMIRIVGMKLGYKLSRDKHAKAMTVYDYDTKETSEWRIEDFKDYAPLEPDATLTVSIATVNDGQVSVKDVIVTASRFIDMKMSMVPYVVCRQNVTDVFYNLLSQSTENNMVGMSCNKDTCPVGMDFRIMLAANNISNHILVNFYRTDTLEDVLKLFNHKKYDEVLKDLYIRHCKTIKDTKALFKSEDHGWCKDLNTLLESNGFKTDINQMLGITDVDFDMSNYIIEKDLPGKDGEKYNSLTDDLIAWLSSIYKVNITDITILKFDHDIDLVEFKESRYFLIRDNTTTLYLLVYNENGEKFEADLDAMDKQYDFSTKFKLDFFSKYNNSQAI